MRSISGVISFVALLAIFASVVQISKAGPPRIPPLLSDVSIEHFSNDERADSANYRLPNTTIPVHYNLELTTHVHKEDFKFTGVVMIDIQVMEETNTVVLHMLDLDISRAILESRDIQTPTPITLVASSQTDLEFLTLTTDGVLPSNTNWTLTINYSGILRTDNKGFYRSTYTDAHNNTRYLATTQFESINARHSFPCYDEPAKRATFTITINHDSTYMAISNMPVNESESSIGHTVFEKTPSMPTYLVAYIVSDFVSTQGVLNNLTQRVFSRPGTELDHEWALVSGMLIIQRLAEYYNIPYGTPKLDQVAVPDFSAGAMENWGLVTYREEYLLYNPQKSTTNTQTNVANIIAHEYAHQWFGNLVTIKWWTYLWLKEGFATLFSYEADDEAYPEWDIYQMFLVSEYQRALVTDGSNTARPMTHYVQTRSEISSLYDTISYQKAGAVLHMFKHALTNDVFQKGLHNYLDQNKYGAAEEDQLFEAIGKAAKELNYELKFEIKEMMSKWTQQSGVPLLTVKRDYTDGSFTVQQSVFNNEEPSTGTGKSWIIPFNYVNKSNGDFRNTEATHYLQENIKVDAKLISDDWLLINKQSTGYYRINYDERNWELIVNGIISEPFKFNVQNRAQLMHDAYRLCVSRQLAHSTLLNLMTYLQAEDQYAPWSTANSILTTFNRYLSGDTQYSDLKFYISSIVQNIYVKLGLNDVVGEQHFTSNVRTTAINLACLAGIPSCIEDTSRKLKGFIYNHIPIEPNLQSSIYCNGLRVASDFDFNYMYDMLLNSEDQAQRRLLISSLGCSQNENQINKFISSSIDQTVTLRSQERYTLLSSAYSRSSIGLLTSIKFLSDNWQVYADLTPGFGGSNPLSVDIQDMSRYVVNTEQEEKLMALVDEVKTSDKVSATLEKDVKSNIDDNFNWLQRNRDPLIGWFGSYRSGGSIITMPTSITLFFLMSLIALC